MTLLELLAVVRRRWVVILMGVVISAMLAYQVGQRPPVYWSQVDVLFLLPSTPEDLNAFNAQTEGLIATAGLVARDVMVGDAASAPQVVSDQVTLVAQGVRDGFSVRLPNTGGQWANSFDRAALDVQAVGPTEAGVRSTMEGLIQRISDDLAAREAAMGVAEEHRIRLRLSPGTPYIRREQGRPNQAMAVAFLLGLGLTVSAAVVVDRRRGRRVDPLTDDRSSRPAPAAMV